MHYSQSCYCLAGNPFESWLVGLVAILFVSIVTYVFGNDRRKQRVEWLNELKKGWDCLNTMHILLCLLRRARLEERPVTAVILLQLDLAVCTL